MGWGPCCGSGVGDGLLLVEMGLRCGGTGMTCERLAVFFFYTSLFGFFWSVVVAAAG